MRVSNGLFVKLMIAAFVLISSPAWAEAQCEGEGCEAAGVEDSAAVPGEASAEGSSVSAGEGEDKKSMKPLWITGIATFSVVYVSTIIVSAALSDEEYKGRSAGLNAIPLAGPFVMIGVTESDPDSYVPSGQKAALVISGVVQILAMTAFITGLSIDLKRKNQTVSFSAAPTLVTAPGTGLTTPGVGLFGTF